MWRVQRLDGLARPLHRQTCQIQRGRLVGGSHARHVRPARASAPGLTGGINQCFIGMADPPEITSNTVKSTHSIWPGYFGPDHGRYYTAGHTSRARQQGEANALNVTLNIE